MKLSKAIQKMIDYLIANVLSDSNFSWSKLWENIATGNNPYNPISKVVYTKINSLILMFFAMKYNSNQFATYKQIVGAKGTLKNAKGKGIPLTKFQYKYYDSEANKWYYDYQLKKLSDEVKNRLTKKLTSYNFVVFSLTLTDLKYDTPKPKRINNPIKKAQNFIDAYKEICDIKIGLDNSQAYYSPASDYISLPDFNAFESAEAFYHVAFHEIGHSTGHKSRLDRDFDKGGFFGDDKYSKEELIAELSANILSAKFNVLNDKLINNSVAYLQGWSKKFSDKQSELYLALTHASKVLEFVTNKTNIK